MDQEQVVVPRPCRSVRDLHHSDLSHIQHTMSAARTSTCSGALSLALSGRTAGSESGGPGSRPRPASGSSRRLDSSRGALTGMQSPIYTCNPRLVAPPLSILLLIKNHSSHCRPNGLRSRVRSGSTTSSAAPGVVNHNPQPQPLPLRSLQHFLLSLSCCQRCQR